MKSLAPKITKRKMPEISSFLDDYKNPSKCHFPSRSFPSWANKKWKILEAPEKPESSNLQNWQSWHKALRFKNHQKSFCNFHISTDIFIEFIYFTIKRHFFISFVMLLSSSWSFTPKCCIFLGKLGRIETKFSKIEQNWESILATMLRKNLREMLHTNFLSKSTTNSMKKERYDEKWWRKWHGQWVLVDSICNREIKFQHLC